MGMWMQGISWIPWEILRNRDRRCGNTTGMEFLYAEHHGIVLEIVPLRASVNIVHKMSCEISYVAAKYATR